MGAPRYTVPLQKIVTEQGLTVLHAAADYDARAISTADVNPVSYTHLTLPTIA